MTTCINSTTKVKDAAAVVTKDRAEVNLEDVNEDATHRLEAAVTITCTETVSIMELIVTCRDLNMSTEPRLRL